MAVARLACRSARRWRQWQDALPRAGLVGRRALHTHARAPCSGYPGRLAAPARWPGCGSLLRTAQHSTPKGSPWAWLPAPPAAAVYFNAFPDSLLAHPGRRHQPPAGTATHAPPARCACLWPWCAPPPPPPFSSGAGACPCPEGEPSPHANPCFPPFYHYSVQRPQRQTSSTWRTAHCAAPAPGPHPCPCPYYFTQASSSARRLSPLTALASRACASCRSSRARCC